MSISLRTRLAIWFLNRWHDRYHADEPDPDPVCLICQAEAKQDE